MEQFPNVRFFMLLGIILFLSACSPGGSDQTKESPIPTTEQLKSSPTQNIGEATVAPTETVQLDTQESAKVIDTHENCTDPFDGEQPRFNQSHWELTNFCKRSIEFDEIFSGGLAPDAIPALDKPIFVSVESADEWIEDLEPIILFGIGSDVRAYPLQVMTWHEIVNDLVADVPVVVTFCPLCNTALVFKRPEINGELLTFGTSGNLRNSDLVMYDRQTESWWQQFSGDAIIGDLTGTQLDFLPTTIISWQDFKENHPLGLVLSKETGYNRDYGNNPYIGYDNINSSPFLFSGEVDDRLPPMARVVGVILPGGSGIAYTYDRLRTEEVINDNINDLPIVIFWKSGTASALDKSSISEGSDVGATGVFQRLLDNQLLTFEQNNNGDFIDNETGSTWNILGEAIAGPLSGSVLSPIPHHDTFWFAWAAFVSPDSLSSP